MLLKLLSQNKCYVCRCGFLFHRKWSWPKWPVRAACRVLFGLYWCQSFSRGFGFTLSLKLKSSSRTFLLIVALVTNSHSDQSRALRLPPGPCGSPGSRCCCSGSPGFCWWRASTRATPSTWTSRSPGASRRSADRSSASSAFAARRARTRPRRRAPCPRRSCCSTTARASCWRSARAWRSPRASARAAKRTTTPKRCRGLTCCPPAATQVSPLVPDTGWVWQRFSKCGPRSLWVTDRGPNRTHLQLNRLLDLMFFHSNVFVFAWDFKCIIDMK